MYCYARYLPEWTGHDGERWGEYVDIKYWKPLTPKQKEKLRGVRVTISSATDPYQPVEQEYRRTRALLEELRGAGADVQIITKSASVVEDWQLLKELDATVAFSINTHDENFRADMDCASTISERMEAMEWLHEKGIHTVCFVSPIFPGITDAPKIIEQVVGLCDEVWLEHLVLQNPYKGTVLYYVKTRHPDVYAYYDEIFNHDNLDLWWWFDDYMEEWCKEHSFNYSYEHYPKEHRSKPVICNFRGHKGR